MSSADVTVVVTAIPPRYQNGNLARCLLSIAGQRLVPKAVVVLVDHDERGPAAMRNEALFNDVRTEWVAWIDDDDELYPHHLQHLFTRADDDADLVFSWYNVLSGGTDPRPQWEKAFDDDYRRSIYDERANCIAIPHLVRADVARAVGGFPIPGSPAWPHPYGEDRGYEIRMLDAGARFVFAGDRTWGWHHHGHNTSGRAWAQFYREYR